nr:hypothetical protein [Deltaproteobacteria bacterium]
MLKQKRSRELADSKRRLSPMDLLVFFLTGLLLLAMVSLSRADTWDDTLVEAKKEGELVVVLGGAASRLYRPIFEVFEDKFGIRTSVSTGSARSQSDRLLAERGARRYKVDIVMFGPTTGNRRMVANNVLDPIEPQLFLPEVVDRSLWYKGKHYYSDPENKYIFAFSGGADL